MNLIEKIKAIEIYVCENFEELGLDDPVEEEYFSAYEEIKGASDKELQTFEEDYGVSLPEDWKKLYRYKNGSGFFSMLPCVLGKGEYAFSLLSLEQIRRVKGYFQNRDALLTDFPDFSSVSFSMAAMCLSKDSRRSAQDCHSARDAYTSTK